MSLIQEALRRRGEETGAPLTLKPPAEITPPPLPPPVEPPARRVGLWLLVVVLVIIGVMGGVAWWKAAQKPAPPPVAKPPVVPTKPPPVVAAKSVAPTNAPATNNIIAKVQAVLEKTVTPERRELVSGVTNAPVAVVSAPPVSVPVAPVVQPAPTPPSPAPRKAVRWPKLTVTGVMARGGGHAMVFVNGQMLASGDELQEVKVIHVTETGARFVYQNETNFVRIGHSTEE